MEYLAWLITLFMLTHAPMAMASTTHGCDRYSAVAPSTQTQHHAPNTAPSVSLEQLIARLKSSSAIGLFTKIALRSDVTALQRDITAAKHPLPILRRQFDGLILKILALLEKDPNLARDIYQARESIWQSLIQPSHSVTTHNQPRSTS